MKNKCSMNTQQQNVQDVYVLHFSRVYCIYVKNIANPQFAKDIMIIKYCITL